MKNIFQNNKNILNKISIIVLVILCLLSFTWFVGTYNNLHRSGELTPDYSIRKGHPTRLNHRLDVNSINTWMTFDYLNVIFNLPKDYLKNTLGIKDPRYPNIRIGTYIKQHNLNSSDFIKNIKQTITIYSENK